MNYEILKNSIVQTHLILQQSIIKAVNRHLTLRNWIIGFYIVEYEQNGEDRAKYGSHLLGNLANDINKKGIKGLTSPELSRTRQFYSTYPSIFCFQPQELLNFKSVNNQTSIAGSTTQEFKSLNLNVLLTAIQSSNILGSLPQEFDTDGLTPEIIHQ